MPLFSGKEAFVMLGLSPIQPSLHHHSQNCTICTLPLTMHPGLISEPPSTASEATSNRAPHPATRINLCNHIVGKECLLAWLDISCACPVCNRILFDATDEEITERDVAFVYKKLRWLWRKWEIFAAIERVMWRRRVERRRREERAPGVDLVEGERGGEGGVFEGEFWDGSEEGEVVEMEEGDEDEEMGDDNEGYNNESYNNEGHDEGYEGENEGEGHDGVGGSEDMDISESSE
ncbi:hypothetical protein COCVIDRAFT_87977 [Bipolaris victoriae FI3]|uniref:RING-type domain-containing protein n=1 Tax=Bipolaris victoriae (strain FI3) TaxID=930091 RepID=W7F600_BIPV3|nr:hypothetical protein COCVIDRAFT_87977 [Bipolaris victoriae FI3]